MTILATMDLITQKDARITAFRRKIEQALNGMEQLNRNCRQPFNGEDREVSERLKISRRALQDHRNQGKIPYLYKESDIEQMLEKAYCRAWE